MANRFTKGLGKKVAGTKSQLPKIPGATVKSIDLKNEGAKQKARRLRLKMQLKKAGLGSTSRDKRRFLKE